MHKDKASITDILDSMRLAVTYLGAMTLEDFEHSIEKVDSVCRRLEIIGEATKRLSGELRDQHPTIPWRTMAGMRDRLIHGYEVVRIDRIYEAVTVVIPPLIPMLAAIAQSLPDPDE